MLLGWHSKQHQWDFRKALKVRKQRLNAQAWKSYLKKPEGEISDEQKLYMKLFLWSSRTKKKKQQNISVLRGVDRPADGAGLMWKDASC